LIIDPLEGQIADGEAQLTELLLLSVCN